MTIPHLRTLIPTLARDLASTGIRLAAESQVARYYVFLVALMVGSILVSSLPGPSPRVEAQVLYVGWVIALHIGGMVGMFWVPYPRWWLVALVSTGVYSVLLNVLLLWTLATIQVG